MGLGDMAYIFLFYLFQSISIIMITFKSSFVSSLKADVCSYVNVEIRTFINGFTLLFMVKKENKFFFYSLHFYSKFSFKQMYQ